MSYSDEMFVDKAQRKDLDQLRCPICLCVMRNATMPSKCQHSFCETCIKNQSNCPLDREPIDPKSLIPCLSVQRQVSELKVSCLYHAQGCPWSQGMGSYQTHVAACQFAPTHCPFNTYGCRAILRKRDLDSHLHNSIEDHLLMVAQYGKQMAQTQIGTLSLNMKSSDRLQSNAILKETVFFPTAFPINSEVKVVLGYQSIRVSANTNSKAQNNSDQKEAQNPVLAFSLFADHITNHGFVVNVLALEDGVLLDAVVSWTATASLLSP